MPEPKQGNVAQWAGRAAAGVALSAAVVGTIAATGSWFGISREPTTTTQTPRFASAGAVAALSNEVADLNAQVEALGKAPKRSRVAADIAAVRATTKRLETKLSGIEAAVVEDPTKALQLPLLRRDLDATRAANAATTEATRADIDRQYDLMKWVFGTFVVALLGTLVTALLALRRTA